MAVLHRVEERALHDREARVDTDLHDGREGDEADADRRAEQHDAREQHAHRAVEARRVVGRVGDVEAARRRREHLDRALSLLSGFVSRFDAGGQGWARLRHLNA